MPAHLPICWHRARRWVRIYFRRTDLLDALANLCLIVVALAGYHELKKAAERRLLFGGAVLYVFFTAWRIIRVARRRRARDATERDTILQLFHRTYAEAFGIAPDRRLTLFVVDPENEHELMPLVRYELGKQWPVAETISHARYHRGEGFTGRAWQEPSNVLFQQLPDFPDRTAFEKYYTNTLKIRPDVVRALSEYMVNVRSIYSYGFLDFKGGLLGVLSVDVKHATETRLRDAELKVMIEALGSVLEAFAFERRVQQ